jgi:hypothetical protein
MSFTLAHAAVFKAAVQRLIADQAQCERLLRFHTGLKEPDPARLERVIVKALCTAVPGLREAEARRRVQGVVGRLLEPSPEPRERRQTAPTARDLTRLARRAQVRRLRQYRR